MDYDVILKYLIDNFPEHIVSFITGKECKVDVLLDSEFPKITRRVSDKLLLITEPTGEKYVLHLEIQSTYQIMVGRMIEYAGMIFRRYGLRILPVVLYLREEDFPKNFEDTYINAINDEEYLKFKFIALKPWDKNYRCVLDSHFYGLYPLVPLMRYDDKNIEEVLKECVSDLEHLNDSSLRSDIYTSIGIIATIKYPYEVISRILEVSRMQESALYQEIYKKGIQEGIEKGLQEGIEKGLQEGIEKGLQEGIRKQQDTLIFLLEERFGKIPQLLKTAIFSVKTDKKLRLLFKEVVKTDSIKTFQNFMEKKILNNKTSNHR